MAVITPTDRPESGPQSLCNRKFSVAFLCCQLLVEFPVGIEAFDIGLSQIPFSL